MFLNLINCGRARCRIFLALLLLFMSVSSSFAQIEDYKVRAGWIIAMIQYTSWHDVNKGKPTICTIGNDSVGVFLREAKSDKALPVLIEEKNMDSSFKDCKVLYISDSEKDRISTILKKINGLPILTISTVKRFAEMGGVVEFITKNNKVSLLINISSVKKAGIVIDSDLLSVSEHIK